MPTFRDARSPRLGRVVFLASLGAASAAAALFLSGCARTPENVAARDPYQPANRRFQKFNDSLDRYFMQPVAKGYTWITPNFVRAGVTNFFSNLNDINVALNDFLQAKPKDGSSDLGRIGVNTTVGLVGVIDVAKHIGLEKHEEDFGQTLGVWGVGEGSYLVLPLLGPSTVRDAYGTAVDSLTGSIPILPSSPIFTFWMKSLGIVNKRASVEGELQAVESLAMDRYSFMREAFRQRRKFMIYDGAPPVEEMFDDTMFEMEKAQAEGPSEQPKRVSLGESALPSDLRK